jgi:hypothetical protein
MRVLLVLVLSLYIEMVRAMVIPEDRGEAKGVITLESINGDMPPNFETIMDKDYIDLAKLALEGKFKEVREFFVTPDEESKESAEMICCTLRKIYDSSFKEYIAKKELLNPQLSVKDFVYNDLLRYFWWNYYYPVYEGLIE